MRELAQIEEETYVDTAAAIAALGVDSHPDIREQLQGVFGQGLGIRLGMLQQLEQERVLGNLVRRGPQFSSGECDCTPNPLWCTRADRTALLKRVVASLPDVDEDGDWVDDIKTLRNGAPKVFWPAELLVDIRHHASESCLANLYCFELTLIRATQRREFVRLEDGRFRVAKARDFSVEMPPKRTAAERKLFETARAEQYPKTNHYREPTFWD